MTPETSWSLTLETTAPETSYLPACGHTTSLWAGHDVTHLDVYLQLEEDCLHGYKDYVHAKGTHLPGLVRHVDMGILNQGHRAQSFHIEG